jgi:serine/threonine protein phosphatase PrpC
MSAQSIYGAICESLNSEGKLPNDFSLPFNKTSPNQLRFIPGAKDGIGIFHFGVKSSEEVSKKIVKLLKNDWKKGSISSQNEIAELLRECSTLSVIDPILDSIRQDRKGLILIICLILLAGLHFSLLMRNWSSWA